MGRVKRSGVGGGEMEEKTLISRVMGTIFTLPNLPPSEQRWRLQQYEHKQAAFARPKYACTVG